MSFVVAGALLLAGCGGVLLFAAAASINAAVRLVEGGSLHGATVRWWPGRLPPGPALLVVGLLVGAVDLSPV